MVEEGKSLDNLRHSCAHLLAAAVLELWPETKLAIGPPIEDGFYYDFEFKQPISESDFSSIEKKMLTLLKDWHNFERIVVSNSEAKQQWSNNPYKQEIIDELAQKVEQISFYKSGNFVDLCRGGHIANPATELQHFKLLSIAGAYWRGDKNNPMLTRIYGTCFPTKKELDHFLWQREEAKKRDHKKIGPAMDLFHLQSEAPGMPFWHSKGMILRNELLKFSRDIQHRYNYIEIQAPNLLAVEIFKKSGHWDHYKENMFFTTGWGDKKYALRPMDCPGTIQIYKFHKHSYRELPLRMAEYGTVTRNEKSGELNGLLRVAQITQDDAHIFLREDQIRTIVQETMQLVEEIYRPFNLEYHVYLSTRPGDYMGELTTWNKAEGALKEAILAQKIKLLLKEKDGAFYGPKIDYQLRDSLGRMWQCATIQLDFQMPTVFNLTYAGEDGNEHRPVIIHRTVMGAIERFIGILIEHFAGAFPVWLHPVQVKILPVSDKYINYGSRVGERIREKIPSIRLEVDNSAETLGNKIRKAQTEKVPYMIIVGANEEKNNSVNLRLRTGEEIGEIALAMFVDRSHAIIDQRSLEVW